MNITFLSPAALTEARLWLSDCDVNVEGRSNLWIARRVAAWYDGGLAAFILSV